MIFKFKIVSLLTSRAEEKLVQKLFSNISKFENISVVKRTDTLKAYCSKNFSYLETYLVSFANDLCLELQRMVFLPVSFIWKSSYLINISL